MPDSAKRATKLPSSAEEGSGIINCTPTAINYDDNRATRNFRLPIRSKNSAFYARESTRELRICLRYLVNVTLIFKSSIRASMMHERVPFPGILSRSAVGANTTRERAAGNLTVIDGEWMSRQP